MRLWKRKDDPRSVELKKAIAGSLSPDITEQEARYFTTSCVLRAGALANLARLLPMQPGRIVEHGCALGLMSLRLMREFPQLFAEAHGSEIKSSYIESGRALWKKFFGDERLLYQKRLAENFAYPKDVSLILFAQVLVKMPEPVRKAAIERAMAVLNPGGFLIVNEVIGDLGGFAGYEIDAAELKELLPGARIYTPRDGFLAADKDKWQSDTFFIHQKPL